MRKLLLVLTMLMLASWALNADELVLKMGMNRNNDMTIKMKAVLELDSGEKLENSMSEDIEKKKNYSASLEYYFDISEKVYFGFGASFESELEDDFEYEDFFGYEVKLIPVYLTGKYKFNPNSRAVFYMGLDVGYTIINIKNLESFIDEKGGLYFGGSLGMEYNNFIAEVKYTQLKCSMEYDEDAMFGVAVNGRLELEEELEMSRVSLNLGYKFEI